MKPVVWAVAVAIGVMSLSGCGQRRPEPLSAFDGRVQDWTREALQDSPELATRAGVSAEIAGGAYNDRLDDRSALATEARRTAALRRLAELRSFNAAELDPDDALTHAVLLAQFSNAAAAAAHPYGDFVPLSGMKPYVLNQLDSAFLTLPDFMDRTHAVESFADAEAYIERLASAADVIDNETARARADAEAGVIPPGFIIDLTIGLLDEISAVPAAQQPYITGFRRKLEALAAQQTDEDALAEAQARAGRLLGQAETEVRTRLIPAHQRAAAFLRSIRARATDDAGAWRLPNGEAYYQDALRLETTTELTPDEIHRIGLARVRELNGQLDIALRRLAFTEGAVGVRLAAMTADPRYRYEDSDAGREQLMADIRGRVAQVMEAAPRWFGTLPEAPLEVQRVPVFAEAASPGAYYSPPSFDGRTPGVYFVNLRNLGEMTRIDLPTQDYHEAVPGHHFQVALAQEQTDIPLLRRLIAFNAYGEGWGLYAEELIDEQGFYENDPIGRIGFLRWQLWRAARLVVDTGLHSKRWTRQQAIDYLVEVTGDAPGTIATEVDRYIVWPGQACGYEIGRREIIRLREMARNELGPEFDLKAFHDVVLLSGELPLSVLAAQVRAWIDRQTDRD